MAIDPSTARPKRPGHVAWAASIYMVGLVLVPCPVAPFGQTASAETLDQALLQVYHNGQNRDQSPPSAELLKADPAIVRERHRSEEQDALMEAVTSYMDVLLDAAIFNLYEDYLTSIDADLRPAGGGSKQRRPTPDELAQLRAERTERMSAEADVRSRLKASLANYVRLFGAKPRMLEPAMPIERDLPQTLDEAVAISQEEHPTVRAARASFIIAVHDTAISRNGFGSGPDIQDLASMEAESIPSSFWDAAGPFYDSAAIYCSADAADALYRLRKEQLHAARDAVRQAVVTAWENSAASAARIEGANSDILRFSDAGNHERSTMQARRGLFGARMALVQAQRDRVVASYSLLAAIGRLSLEALHIRSEPYGAVTHMTSATDAGATSLSQ